MWRVWTRLREGRRMLCPAVGPTCCTGLLTNRQKFHQVDVGWNITTPPCIIQRAELLPTSCRRTLHTNFPDLSTSQLYDGEVNSRGCWEERRASVSALLLDCLRYLEIYYLQRREQLSAPQTSPRSSKNGTNLPSAHTHYCQETLSTK